MGADLMGRTLPYECHHGTTVDWGDFGPHQNGCDESCFVDGCPDRPGCEQCDAEAEQAQEAWRQGLLDPWLDLQERLQRAHKSVLDLADASQSRSRSRRLCAKADGIGVALSYVNETLARVASDPAPIGRTYEREGEA